LPDQAICLARIPARSLCSCGEFGLEPFDLAGVPSQCVNEFLSLFRILFELTDFEAGESGQGYQRHNNSQRPFAHENWRSFCTS
jgi:hypothetical protein